MSGLIYEISQLIIACMNRKTFEITIEQWEYKLINI